MDKNLLKNRRVRILIAYLVVMALVTWLLGPLLGGLLGNEAELSYSEFKEALRAGEVVSVAVGEEEIAGELVDGSVFSTVRVEDPELIGELETNGVEVTGIRASEGGWLSTLVGWLLPIALMLGFWYWMLNRAKKSSGAAGSNIFSFGQSKARVVTAEQTGVTFDDVGGAEEAITELREITDYLKDPQKLQRLGGKMPKGVLLAGPPGTGKTLLARATAGEAQVPFFSVSAAEFIEMFVGVGASRVRDLFDKAKKTAPSIIFIDEIDAIGGRRSGSNGVGSHEEREQTLNQLLAEMDGFESSSGVIVMAATNRPDMLDPALLRPGRFDRQITVDLPDLSGREEILRIHTAGMALAGDVDLGVVARITPGFSGADLANVMNEAAILAARRNRAMVEMADVDAAIERIVAGSARSTRAMNEREKRVVAVHEAGHALVASLLPTTDPVHKVTIVPRGRSLGYTMQRPTEDRYLLNEGELHDRLAVLLGGRVAEALTFDEVSTGAADDLTRATDLARRMVTEYGMSPSLGPVRLAAEPQSAYLGAQLGLDARISPVVAAEVDAETRRIVEEAVERAWGLLQQHEAVLVELAELLYEHETVEGEQVLALLGEPIPADAARAAFSPVTAE